MRSETSVNIQGLLDGNGFLFLKHFSIQHTPIKLTEAECINAFPTKHPVKHLFIHLPGKAA